MLRRQFTLLIAAGASREVVGLPLLAGGVETVAVEVIGTVLKASPKTVDVMSGGQKLTLVADDHTESWKGRTLHDFSQLEPGDSVNAKYRKDESGRLVAITLWANRVVFSGVISTSGGGKLEVLTDPSSHPDTTYQEMKVVDLGFDTVLQGGTRKELRKGRAVAVTGVDLRNGSVHATLVVLR